MISMATTKNTVKQITTFQHMKHIKCPRLSPTVSHKFLNWQPWKVHKKTSQMSELLQGERIFFSMTNAKQAALSSLSDTQKTREKHIMAFRGGFDHSTSH